MKICLLFLFVFTFQLMATDSKGQDAVIVLESNYSTVSQLINQIEKQTDYLVVYSNREVDTNREVFFQQKSDKVSSYLYTAFSDTDIGYNFENDYIILSKKAHHNAATSSPAIQPVPQGRTVTGTVTDETGEPVIGATIVVKDTPSQGTVTDINGVFSMMNLADNAILQITYVGMQSQEINTTGLSVINIILNADVELLEEVVVVGYGTQKKANLTGAVSVVSMDKALGDRPITNVGSALQGAMPGLQITGTGSPGAGRTYNIRGATSITETSSGTQPGPLILIDDVEGQINLVNPEDIETVTVLKDAASAAIYGARAAYGVILITTKRAKKNQKITLNYNNNFAFDKVDNLLKPADVSDIVGAFNEWQPGGSWYADGQRYDLWLDWINEYQNDPVAFERKANANGEFFNSKWGLYVPGSGPGQDKYFYLKSNNAQNEVFDNFGFTQTHNVSASGGREKITYRISLGYTDQDGPLKTNKDNYQRVTVSSQLSADMTDWLNQSLNIGYAQRTRNTVSGGFDSSYHNFLPGADYWAMASDLEGPQYLTTAPLTNIIHQNSSPSRSENPRISAKTTLTPFKGFIGILHYTYDENVYDATNKPLTLEMLSPQARSTSNADPEFYREKTTSRYTSLNAYATYSLSLSEKHNLKLMGGYSQEQRYYESLWAARKEPITPDNPSITGSEGEIRSGDNYTDYAIRSGYFRFNYDYDGKYLFEANGRYDGSSKFPKDYRFGFFPSFSIGWQVGRESFMEWASPWLSELKIRGSWGEIGNQSIADYTFYPTMSVTQRADWVQGDKRPLTLNAPAMVRSNFTWERAATLNLGVDISLLKNRFQASFELFKRNTKDMLGPVDEYPSVVGAVAPYQNSADMQTKGWELSANWRDNINDWGYSIGLNLWDNRSHITKYKNEAKLLSTYYVGQEIGEIWGYVFDRFYTVDDFQPETVGSTWLLKDGVTSIRGYSPRPGDIIFKNLNDEETSENEIWAGSENTADNPGDRKVIGNNSLRYQFGANASISYKGISLSILLQGVGKRDVWLGGNITFPLVGTNENNDPHGTVYKHQIGKYVQVKDAANGDYTLINPNAHLPRLYGQPGPMNTSNRRVSDRYLLDASYLRVKNITLGYVLPKKIVQIVGLTNARIFYSAENIFTFSKLPAGVDPERISWGYPVYVTNSFGINITL